MTLLAGLLCLQVSYFGSYSTSCFSLSNAAGKDGLKLMLNLIALLALLNVQYIPMSTLSKKEKTMTTLGSTLEILSFSLLCDWHYLNQQYGVLFFSALY